MQRNVGTTTHVPRGGPLPAGSTSSGAPGASLAGGVFAPRVEPLRVIGSPKSGLRIVADEEGSDLTFRGRADPLLLYFVFGTAVVVGGAGSVLVSPVYGLAGVMLLSLLFLPLLVFVALGALRLSSTCRIARAEGRVVVAERSYAGQMVREWPLSALQAPLIVVRPPSGFAGSGPTYELYLDLGIEQYLVQSGGSERSVRREAQRIARFLGLAVRGERLPDTLARTPFRHVALIAVLFTLPLVGSTLGFAYLFREQPPTTSLMIVSMSALVVCQVGAILAYGFNRSQHGRVRD